MTQLAQEKTKAQTNKISPEIKNTPPFKAGELVECRGWRGVLEDVEDPFGESGKERIILRDCYGIGYFHDPASDLVLQE